MTIQEFKEKTKERPNGYYAIKICMNCGHYLIHPEGDYRTARVVKKCRLRCLKDDEPEEKLEEGNLENFPKSERRMMTIPL